MLSFFKITFNFIHSLNISFYSFETLLNPSQLIYRGVDSIPVAMCIICANFDLITQFNHTLHSQFTYSIWVIMYVCFERNQIQNWTANRSQTLVHCLFFNVLLVVFWSFFFFINFMIVSFCLLFLFLLFFHFKSTLCCVFFIIFSWLQVRGID